MAAPTPLPGPTRMLSGDVTTPHRLQLRQQQQQQQLHVFPVRKPEMQALHGKAPTRILSVKSRRSLAGKAGIRSFTPARARVSFVARAAATESGEGSAKEEGGGSVATLTEEFASSADVESTDDDAEKSEEYSATMQAAMGNNCKRHAAGIARVSTQELSFPSGDSQLASHVSRAAQTSPSYPI